MEPASEGRDDPGMRATMAALEPNSAGLTDAQLGAHIEHWASLHTGESYKPIAYVKAECASLAKQAAEAAALAST